MYAEEVAVVEAGAPVFVQKWERWLGHELACRGCTMQGAASTAGGLGTNGGSMVGAACSFQLGQEQLCILRLHGRVACKAASMRSTCHYCGSLPGATSP